MFAPGLNLNGILMTLTPFHNKVLLLLAVNRLNIRLYNYMGDHHNQLLKYLSVYWIELIFMSGWEFLLRCFSEGVHFKSRFSLMASCLLLVMIEVPLNLNVSVKDWNFVAEKHPNINFVKLGHTNLIRHVCKGYGTSGGKCHFRNLKWTQDLSH